jgi:hypothetical protein
VRKWREEQRRVKPDPLEPSETAAKLKFESGREKKWKIDKENSQM